MPTLLVFSVYSQLIKINPFFSLVIKRAKAICVITKEVCRLYIKKISKGRTCYI
jgi:hypothetical protein